MRIVFMGTPEIARQCLEALLQAGHDIVAVYTRADKPVGRKQLLTAPPVKQLAEAQGISVFQPNTLRQEEVLLHLQELAPDLIVVVAYGRLLPKEILDLPRHGCINLHVSSLPKYRGAAPIQWAVIDGCEKTGVSIMQLDEGLDTGDVLSVEEFAIDEESDAAAVLSEATRVGARLLCDSIEEIKKGTAVAKPQEGEVSLAPMLDKQMAEMSFVRSAKSLHNLVRGCNPWPFAWFSVEGKKIKVLHTRVSALQGTPGEVLQLKPLVLACGEGALEIVELLPEGKKAMSGTQWAQGRRLQIGKRLLEIE